MMVVANIAVPWLWQYDKIAVLTIGPAMLAEWLVVYRMAKTGYFRSLGIATLMNLVSTLAGYPLVLIMQGPMNVAGFGTMVLLCLPIACAVTIFVEWAVLRAFAPTVTRAWRISITCNIMSYLIIVLIIMFTGYV